MECGIKNLSVMLFELDAAKLKPLRSRTNRFTHLAEYPETDYDISMLFDADAKWTDIHDAILGKKKASALLKAASFADEYRGRQIPAGRVATYGQIALLCEKPRNARQVGYALKNGLAGEGIPAYRVVNSQGILSGAVHFETYDMQKMLLEAEGVRVIRTEKGFRVDLKTYGWNNTMADALYLKSLFEEGGKGEIHEGAEAGHESRPV